MPAFSLADALQMVEGQLRSRGIHDQLAVGGMMAAPVGPQCGDPELRILSRTERGVVTEHAALLACPASATRADCTA